MPVESPLPPAATRMSRTRRPEIPAETLLRHQALFKELDARTLGRLAAACRRVTLSRGDALFRRGDMPAGMYVLVFGSIQLLAPQGASGRRLTGMVRPGRSFGEPVMFLGRPAMVDAVAAEDSLVLQLPNEALFDEIEANPLLARRLLAALSRRVEALVHELEKHATGSGRARLIHYLLDQWRAAGGESVLLPTSKASVASQLHLTPEHFSRLLHELAAEGLVRVEARRVHILDAARMAAAESAPRRRRSPGPTAPP